MTFSARATPAPASQPLMASPWPEIWRAGLTKTTSAGPAMTPSRLRDSQSCFSARRRGQGWLPAAHCVMGRRAPAAPVQPAGRCRRPAGRPDGATRLPGAGPFRRDSGPHSAPPSGPPAAEQEPASAPEEVRRARRDAGVAASARRRPAGAGATSSARRAGGCGAARDRAAVRRGAPASAPAVLRDVAQACQGARGQSR